ncbi:hypothetical protein [Sporosarcina sp. YIM B06819]|uniref:hypothetical protein n=1 Tax=Sporosarcina sp. YIM B06819 TaxID=3081769 RepID=UPI00298C6C43|nr:hypothetical protein [Sporosarcina sp. YIM B06819]
MSFPTSAPITSQVTLTAVQAKPLVMNEGQMFHGQIKQLFPGQVAEVQIGNQKLIAKLEVPMKAGDSYYFQVKAVEPELQLKIISGPTQTAEGQAPKLGGLMDAMQLPKTPEMQALLTTVMKNKITMTRENLLEAEAMLKSVPAAARNEALASIQKIVELKLPFNETIFRSLLGVETKEGLHAVLTSLKTALMADSAVSAQVKDVILAALDKMAKPMAQATGGALLGQSLLTLLSDTESSENRFSILQMLKSAGILPQQTSLANLQQVLASLLTNGDSGRAETSLDANVTRTVQTNQISAQPIQTQAPLQSAQSMQEIATLLKQMGNASPAQMKASIETLKVLIAAEPTINTSQKAVLMAILDRPMGTPPAADAATKLVQEFSHALIRGTAENAISTQLQMHTPAQGFKEQLLTLLGQQSPQQGAEKLATLVQAAERSDNGAIQKALQTAETAVAAAVDGKAVKEALQTVMRSFGLNYEAGLLGKDADVGRLAETLKPQLLALMQDLTVSPALREAAETVVMRMNGPLLQSGENGVQHQLIMQVPLEFFGKRIDATLQWNGRMKDNGKIDPDFARILFYLDLGSIDKTVIDMQVQNRVISVTVFNADDTLKAVAAPLQHKLKEGLGAAGYKLSAVFFKNFIEEEEKMSKMKKSILTDGQGVDFRI